MDRDSKPQCSESGCDRKVHAHGRCTKHYQQWYKKRLPGCSVEGCEKQVLSINWDYCGRHHYRMKTRGDVGAPGVEVYNQGTLEERFWRKVEKTESCWLWTGYVSPNGYAIFSQERQLAHRFSYELANGPLTSDMTIHHTCANRACVNPEHLQFATRSENTLEMLERRSLNARIGQLEAEIDQLRAENADLKSQIPEWELAYAGILN